MRWSQHFYTREEYNMYKKDNMYQYIIWFPVKKSEIAKYDDRHVFKAVEYTPDDRVIYDDFIFFTGNHMIYWYMLSFLYMLYSSRV